MVNLLQDEALNASPDSHCPFHLAGAGGMPMSLKLGDSGQIPTSLVNKSKSNIYISFNYFFLFLFFLKIY